MIVPIICRELDCVNNGGTINQVSGLNPQDLDGFYEGYIKPEGEDYCPKCGKLGVAEDPEFEHQWERNYYDADDK